MATYWINYEVCDEFKEKELEFEARDDAHARKLYDEWKSGMEGYCTFSYLANEQSEELEV